jgi:hypothetical protein
MSDPQTVPTTPDIVVIEGISAISVSVDACWSRIGRFEDAGRFLAINSRLLSGDGSIGSVRLIGDGIVEVMVGESETSYTYSQLEGPMAPFHYHGSVHLAATGTSSCRLTYSISYDQASMDEERRAAERKRIAGRFQGAADEMKRFAEGASADAGGRTAGH